MTPEFSAPEIEPWNFQLLKLSTELHAMFPTSSLCKNICLSQTCIQDNLDVFKVYPGRNETDYCISNGLFSFSKYDVPHFVHASETFTAIISSPTIGRDQIHYHVNRICELFKYLCQV